MNVFYVSMCVSINLLHQSLIKVAIFPWIHITRAIYILACILIRIVFDFIISQDLFSFSNCIFFDPKKIFVEMHEKKLFKCALLEPYAAHHNSNSLSIGSFKSEWLSSMFMTIVMI